MCFLCYSSGMTRTEAIIILAFNNIDDYPEQMEALMAADAVGASVALDALIARKAIVVAGDGDMFSDLAAESEAWAVVHGAEYRA